MGEENIEDYLLTAEVASRERVSAKTVQRWIGKGLPAIRASNQQLAALLLSGRLTGVPARQGAFLIAKKDLGLIPEIRAYPQGTTRRRRVSN